MRTTLDIDDDVLAAAKEQARQQGISAGAVISELARQALTASGRQASELEFRNGIPLLPRRGALVTPDLVRKLMD